MPSFQTLNLVFSYTFIFFISLFQVTSFKGHFQFATFKPLSDQWCGIYRRFFKFKNWFNYDNFQYVTKPLLNIQFSEKRLWIWHAFLIRQSCLGYRCESDMPWTLIIENDLKLRLLSPLSERIDHYIMNNFVYQINYGVWYFNWSISISIRYMLWYCLHTPQDELMIKMFSQIS